MSLQNCLKLSFTAIDTLLVAWPSYLFWFTSLQMLATMKRYPAFINASVAALPCGVAVSLSAFANLEIPVFIDPFRKEPAVSSQVLIFPETTSDNNCVIPPSTASRKSSAFEDTLVAPLKKPYEKPTKSSSITFFAPAPALAPN
jgi:hypothetical protein